MTSENTWEKKRLDSLKTIERSNKEWCREWCRDWTGWDPTNPVSIIKYFKERYEEHRASGYIIVPDLIIEKLKQATEQASYVDRKIFYYHSLRIDQNSPDCNLLAYYPSNNYRQRERLVSITPGKYLQKFYAWVWNTEKEFTDFVRDYIESVANANNVHFARSIGEIQRVYDTGPRSCMGNGGESDKLKRLRTRNKIHPVAAYASGDLAIAYLKHPTNKDKVTARCVVWPDKKVYGRLYGDSHRLQGGLRELGYKEGSFEGARVRKIKMKTGFLLPYMDHWYNLRDEDEKSFRIVGSSTRAHISARFAGGFARAFKCAVCEKYSGLEHRHPLTLNGARRLVCRGCWEGMDLKRCGHCSVYYRKIELQAVKTVDFMFLNNPYQIPSINKKDFREVLVCKKCFKRHYKENTCATCNVAYVSKKAVSKKYKGNKICVKCFRSDRTKTLSKCERRIVDVKKKSNVKCNCFVCHLESEKVNAHN